MKVLIAFAFALTGILVGMDAYVKVYLPDGPKSEAFRLRRGLQLGAVSSTVSLLTCVLFFYFPPASLSLFWPIAVYALAGNILNLVSVVYCLREITPRGLFAALVVLLNQALWILLLILAVTVNF